MSTTMNVTELGRYLIQNYDPDSMDFLIWLNNFEYVIVFCKVPDDKKVEFLLDLIGPTSLSIIEQKLAPINPRNLPYDELISELQQMFSFFQGVWAARFRFLNRDRYICETVPEYVLALRRISSKARISVRSNESLMKRFIDGLENENIQNVLRRCSNLTFARAVAIAQQMDLYRISTYRN